MKKKILSIILAVVMIVGMLPLGAITAFANGEGNGEYTITNQSPESEKDSNNGYVSVPEKAEAGAEVTIAIHPNEGYKIMRLGYKRDYSKDAASETDGSLNPEFRSPIFKQDGTAQPTDTKIVAGERVTGGTDFSVAYADTAEISAVEFDTSAPDSISFVMPAYPIVIVAEFGLSNPQWTSWEPFDVGTGKWSFTVIAGETGSYNVKIREEKNHPNLKQLKVESWGAGVLPNGYGINLILEWNTDTNTVTIPEQFTYLVEISTGLDLMIQDYNSFTFTSLNRSYYDAAQKTFYIPVIYFTAAECFGYGYEKLKMTASNTLEYDSDDENFSATFTTDDTEISYEHDEDEWVALVHATDSALNTVALCVSLPKDSTEIPAGTYNIDKTMNSGTVLASSGIVNGNQVTYSFAGNRNSAGLITIPIWFMVGGKVTVSYAKDAVTQANVMTMVIDAVNSYGKDIDVTITKVIPPKHNITYAATDPNGAVIVDQNPAEEGSAVTLTVIPENGYRLKAGTLKAVYNAGGEKQLDLIQDSAEKNKFTFIVPASDVTVTAEFEEAEDTFKAVWNSSDGVLSFFYDKLNHMGDGISVFDELPTETVAAADWPYDSIREDVAEVKIDASVANYTGLKSTAYMFSGMFMAENISGAEYLNIANVTNMEQTFTDFGGFNGELNVIPDVSGWNTEKVTNMSGVFSGYGFFSMALDKVPDVSGWNTEKVTNMNGIFNCYGYSSSLLNDVPDVGAWKTGEVTDMNSIFFFYGSSSTVLNKIPDVAGWNTQKVTNLGQMFQYYGYSSEELTSVPNINAWNTENVKNSGGMFNSYGATSQKLNFSLDLSGWNLSNAENIGYMFNYAGANAASWKVCIPYMTGELKNNPSSWYGKDNTVLTAPLTDKQFTLVYPVLVDENIQNGKIETDVAGAQANTTVSVTVTADKGFVYKSGSLKATYNEGSKILELELNQDESDKEKYYFTMPAECVTVTAEFEEIPHTHNLIKVTGQAATETAAGFKDYYECKDSDDACHEYFEDATGFIPIENLDAWKSSTGNGYLAPLVHTVTPVNGQDATDTEAGYKAYYECKNCGKLFEDATCKVEITDLDAWKAPGGNGYLPKLKEEPTSPQTGDTSNRSLWVMLLVLSSMGICVCLVLGKKRKNVQ